MKNAKEIKIAYYGYAPTLNDIDDLCNNFYEGYPSWAFNMEETDFDRADDGSFKIIWEGTLDVTESEINKLIRLTHHAEGFYANTNIEYTHVEVCIDNTWYGK